MRKQAKLKALSLLTRMDRTEAQLRQKLKEKEYPEEVIEHAVSYVKSFGYINDLAYAERYIQSRMHTKSRRELYAGLLQKGVSKEHVLQALEICYESESEIDAIRRLCEKKHFHSENCTEDEKKKIYGYLMRKGFRHEDVWKVINLNA